MPAARSDLRAFSADLMASFHASGFAVIADHGLDPAVIAAAEGAARAFFAQPLAEKLRWRLEGRGGARGYTPFRTETAKGARVPDLKEFWHVGRDLPPSHRYAPAMPPNLWPETSPDFRAPVEALYVALDQMAAVLLRAVAAGLDLPSDWFEDKAGEGDSVLRLAHYPPVAPGAEGVRAGAHEDINVITLLLGAEEAGLEILMGGRWLPVNPPPGALVVNVGDMLQRLTNHVLPSTTHRVVNPAPERGHLARLSTPFFAHFNPDFVIRTLPGCVSPSRPDRHPDPITAHAYLQQRLEEIGLKGRQAA